MPASDWAISVLHDYLRIPSVSAQGRSLPECAGFLVRMFREAGLEARTVEAGGPPVVLAAAGPGTARRSILFYNHYDVQPAEPLEEWRSNPFEPSTRDGYLYARGVADNKANLVARVAAVRELFARGPLPARVKFLVEGEEEIGSFHLGAAVEREKTFIASDLCIWESAYRDERGRPQIVLGVKGIVHGELVVRGPAADQHSSRGVIVPNPAWRLAWALASIKGEDERVRVRGFYDRVQRPTAADLDAVGEVPFEEEELRRRLGIPSFLLGLTGEELKVRFFFEPAFNVCGIVGGYTGQGHKTILPREARAKFDIRLVPDMDPEEVVAQLRSHVAGLGGVEVMDAWGYPPARTPVDDPMVGLVRDAGREAWGKAPIRLPLTPASGPMYHFRRLMPCIGVGIGHAGSNIHAPNESIALSDFPIGVRHVKRIIEMLGAA